MEDPEDLDAIDGIKKYWFKPEIVIAGRSAIENGYW